MSEKKTNQPPESHRNNDGDGGPFFRSETLIDPDDLDAALSPAKPSGPEFENSISPPGFAVGDDSASALSSATAYRPLRRPPVPILVALDDGKTVGQEIRIRGFRLVIGRTEGDLRFPLDALMSPRHFEINCQRVHGAHRWILADAGSKDGLWLRVHKRPLRDGDEFLAGRERFRFETARQSGSESDLSDKTIGWEECLAGPSSPTLQEVRENGDGIRLPLAGLENWIGRDPGCAFRFADDPSLGSRHVRLSRNHSGEWIAENRSPGGIWLRISQFVAKDCFFQAGEQRFHFKVPT